MDNFWMLMTIKGKKQAELFGDLAYSCLISTGLHTTLNCCNRTLRHQPSDIVGGGDWTPINVLPSPFHSKCQLVLPIIGLKASTIWYVCVCGGGVKLKFIFSPPPTNINWFCLCMTRLHVHGCKTSIWLMSEYSNIYIMFTYILYCKFKFQYKK